MHVAPLPYHPAGNGRGRVLHPVPRVKWHPLPALNRHPPPDPSDQEYISPLLNRRCGSDWQRLPKAFKGPQRLQEVDELSDGWYNANMAETQTGTHGKPKLKPRGKPFTKGNPGGPGRGYRSAAPAMGSDVILDMKQAYQYPAADDDSEGVKAARRLLKEDYTKFIAYYTKLTVPQVEAGRESEVEEAGEREERIVDLAERLLKEWETQGA